MTSRLSDKTAIITGAGSGIGKAISRVLAEENMHLILAGRTRARLEATAAEVQRLAASVQVVPTDITIEAGVVSLFTIARESSRSLDLVVNNAGTFEGGPIEGIELETWQHVLAVNLTGPFLCTREAMRIMKPQRGGRIINVGSISAQMPRMHSLPYTTTKHGLVGLTKAAALEGREFGISVSCIHPGNVLTERRAASDAASDQEPMMTCAELAETIRTMAALPAHVNMLEAIVLPVRQTYLGRG
ncbi:MAG: SDR family oxidoreductase [Planctomycetota bacterium]|nr:SDR family oxidoreductase [Planctomycetota bacterium]